jgi:protein required for attachment to host cells
MKKKRTWFVIADGGRARVMTRKAEGSGYEEVENFDFVADHRQTKDINADRPGRSFNSVGGSRHAMEPPTDPHREEKRKFAHRLCDYLDEKRGANAFDQLVIVAAPRTLGDLRDALSEAVKDKVVEEIAKDIVKVPTADMNDMLGKLVTIAH